jgi:hypothetical protein
VRNSKCLTGGVVRKTAHDRFARRECDSVDDDVEVALFAFQEVECRVDLAIDGHVQGHGEFGADGLG